MTSTHDTENTNAPAITSDETESLPVPVQKTPEQVRIEELERALRDAGDTNVYLRAEKNDMRAVIGHQATEIRGYIEQDLVAGKAWRDKFQATAVELRLLQKTGLMSGCGCPIGVCLGGASTASRGACWVQWAEGFVMKRRGELIIDELRTQASHPARVAAAQREQRAQQAQQHLARPEDSKS